MPIDDKYKYLTPLEANDLYNADQGPGTTMATESIARTPAEEGKRCGECGYAEKHPDLLSHQRQCMEGYGIKTLGSMACNVFADKADLVEVN